MIALPEDTTVPKREKRIVRRCEHCSNDVILTLNTYDGTQGTIKAYEGRCKHCEYTFSIPV